MDLIVCSECDQIHIDTCLDTSTESRYKTYVSEMFYEYCKQLSLPTLIKEMVKLHEHERSYYTKMTRHDILIEAEDTYDKVSEFFTYDELVNDYHRFRPALFTSHMQ